MTNDDNRAEIARLVHNAPALRPAVPEPATAEPPDGDEGTPADAVGLPADCPVTPLGVEGDVLWVLDSLKQLRGIKAAKLSRLELLALFARGGIEGWIYQHYRRFKANEGGKPIPLNNWHPDKLAEDLIAACAEKGVFKALEHVRGLGGWKDEATGDLVLHCGDRVLVVPADGAPARYHRPGLIGAFIYPQDRVGPRPYADDVDAGPDGPAAELMELLQTWSLKRGEVDARLLLGMLGAMILAGAPDWRPMLWVTGDTSTGKSTLQKLILLLMGGRGGMVTSSDATAAGLWQKVQLASVPIQIDELEPSEDNRRATAIIQLARLAASGAAMLRGGAEHVGKEFAARSNFLFSSINIPPMLAQDRNRMAIVELNPLREGLTPPKLDAEALGEIGAQLRRRMVMGWPRFADTLALYRAGLQALGHGQRGADQFGMLLTCADLLEGDELPVPDVVALRCEPLAAANLAELAGAAPGWQNCLDYLTTKILDAGKATAKRAVQWHINRAAYGEATTLEGYGDPESRRANYDLQQHGMSVTRSKGIAGPLWFAVAVNGEGIAGLFRDSMWQARAGQVGSTWSDTLLRATVAGKPVARRTQVRINGKPTWVTLLPFTLVAGTEPTRDERDGFEIEAVVPGEAEGP